MGIWEYESKFYQIGSQSQPEMGVILLGKSPFSPVLLPNFHHQGRPPRESCAPKEGWIKKISGTMGMPNLLYKPTSMYIYTVYICMIMYVYIYIYM